MSCLQVEHIVGGIFLHSILYTQNTLKFLSMDVAHLLSSSMSYNYWI